jgi:hypothetical protein
VKLIREVLEMLIQRSINQWSDLRLETREVALTVALRLGSCGVLASSGGLGDIDQQLKIELSGMDILTSVGIGIWSTLWDRFWIRIKNSFGFLGILDFSKYSPCGHLISRISHSLTVLVCLLPQYGSHIENIVGIM